MWATRLGELMTIGKRVFIIAEAGVNHNGDIQTALKMIDAASASGVDAIKFQTFNTECLVTKSAPQAKYQKTNCDGGDGGQYTMLKKLELSEKDHQILFEHCNTCGIQFLSTAFDDKSIDLLLSFDLPIWKIPSGEITNLPYLQKIGRIGRKVILSTGMANLGEIESAINAIVNAGTKHEDISLLHCTTEYPAPFEEINLQAMNTLKTCFKLPVGYSDHTAGLDVPIAAVAMGAVIIEKHFTLDKTMEGPDHKASIEPQELTSMVRSIRNIEMALGDGIKRSTVSEIKNIEIARKSIVALVDICIGDMFTEHTITTKRPGNGISPMEWYSVLGMRAKRNFAKDELIEL